MDSIYGHTAIGCGYVVSGGSLFVLRRARSCVRTKRDPVPPLASGGACAELVGGAASSHGRVGFLPVARKVVRRKSGCWSGCGASATTLLRFHVAALNSFRISRFLRNRFWRNDTNRAPFSPRVSKLVNTATPCVLKTISSIFCDHLRITSHLLIRLDLPGPSPSGEHLRLGVEMYT